jgi:hypothetical protein
MDRLEMLSAREQLMEDIDCIIESNFGEVEYKDDVIRMLCDAVCNNFPTNWDIEFDFGYNYGDPKLYYNIVGSLWEAENENDLLAKITRKTGRKILYINYHNTSINVKVSSHSFSKSWLSLYSRQPTVCQLEKWHTPPCRGADPVPY